MISTFKKSNLVRVGLAVVTLILASTQLLPANASGPGSLSRDGAQLLSQGVSNLISATREKATQNGACRNTPANKLQEIICEGRIRIGVREYYPSFGTRQATERSGYDVDVGRYIAKALGVTPEFQRVNATTRIAYANEGRIDLIIATMGHNTRREEHVSFVRPHYYQSETIIVGPKTASVKSFADLKGQSVCVTIGNGSNVHMASQGLQIRLMKTGPEMIRSLKDGLCKFAAQDSSYFAGFLSKPDFGARFETKFGFLPVPWGMGTAKKNSDELNRILSAISADFHRNGVFVKIAKADQVDATFLKVEQTKWSAAACKGIASDNSSACLNPPLQSITKPFVFAEFGRAIEKNLTYVLGTKLTLPMLTDANAWRIFRDGVMFSLILVCSTIIVTAGAAVLLGGLLALRLPLVDHVLKFIVLFFQSCPIVLLLVIASTIWISVFDAGPISLVIMAALALGTFNGSLAGKAIYEQFLVVSQSPQSMGLPFAEQLRLSVRRSATQLTSWIINGVKGTPIASFVGTPELLSALTEVTAFTGERVVTYVLALLFYLIIVGIVTLLLRWVEQGFKETDEMTYA